MLCNEKRALGATNENTENMFKIDEIFIPLSEIPLTHYVRYG